MNDRIKAAVIRGIRTFVAAFIAVYAIPDIIGWASGSQPLDTSALRAAAVSGGAAVISLLWRQFLDPSPIPSLKDPDQTTPAVTT